MPGRKWKQEEIEFIKNNYAIMTYEEIGQKLNRTKKAVTHVGASLGLIREPQIGDKFGRLTIKDKIVEFILTQNVTYVICECECGNTHKVKLTHIKQGHTLSCGCLRNEKASERIKEQNFKHGEADLKGNRLYRIWAAMKSRCNTISSISYKDYGARGIAVNKEWNDNFISFKNWSLSNGYTEELTIDRINVNGNYEPSNCRWITIQEQARNRRNNRMDTVKITAFGETKSVIDWLNDPRCNLKTTTGIIYRIGAGWTPEDAISKPSERS